MRRFLSLLSVIAAAAGVLLAAPAAAPAIVGGQTAATNGGIVSIWTENPYRNRCSGALVDDNQIALAAHCYYSLTAPDAGRVEVRIGAVDNTKPCTASTLPGADCYISRTIIDYDAHPGFNLDLTGTRDDLMVAVLDADVPPQKAKPMQWQTSPLNVGQQFRVQGYGWVCDGPPGLSCSTWYAGPLQQANFAAMPDSSCPTMDDPAGQVCFKHAQGLAVSPCPGDSGAGGFVKGLDRNVLKVVVIGDGDDVDGRSCTTAPDGSPGAAYGINVGEYQDWLSDVIIENKQFRAPPVVSAASVREAYELAG